MQSIATVFTVAGLLLVLYLPALWGWQIYRWLETDQWVPLPAMLAFQNVSRVRLMAGASLDRVVRDNAAVLDYVPQLPRPEWMDHPKQWLGLRRVSMWVLLNAHLGFCTAALGVVSLVLGAYLFPRRPRRYAEDAFN